MRLEKLLGEKHVRYREEAVRYGLFLGAFSGGYHLVRCQLCTTRFGYTPQKAALAAGTAAGLSAVFLKRPKRRAFAGYLAARLAQSALASWTNKREAGKHVCVIPKAFMLLLWQFSFLILHLNAGSYTPVVVASV